MPTDTEPETPTETISRLIRRALFDASQTVTAFEKAVGIGHTPMYKRLAGEVPWRFNEINAAATWLGVDRDTLLPEGELTWGLVLSLTP